MPTQSRTPSTERTEVGVGAVEEYRSLRQELLGLERSRLLVIGFTALAVSTAGTFGLRAAYEGSAAPTGVAVLALFVLLVSVLMVLRLSQRMQLIRVYLARYVEPALPGAKWEQRRLELDELTSNQLLRRTEDGGVIALMYLGGAGGTFIAYFAASISHPLYGCIAVPVLAATVAWASLDLITRGRRNAGERIWDTFETVALLGAGAARPLVARVWKRFSRLLPNSRTVDRLRTDLPPAAEVRLERPQAGPEARTLQQLSGLTDEEFAAVRAANALDGLAQVVDLLGGGLGCDGMAEWLRAGEPARLSYLQRGQIEPIVADAAEYVGFPHHTNAPDH
jgi:hypothetical protein